MELINAIALLVANGMKKAAYVLEDQESGSVQGPEPDYTFDEEMKELESAVTLLEEHDYKDYAMILAEEMQGMFEAYMEQQEFDEE